MKTMKRIASLLLALCVMFAMTATAFAANADGTVTITAPDTGDHTYSVYQVMVGDYFVKDGKKVLSNLKWGDNAVSTKTGDVAETDLDAIKDLDGNDKAVAKKVAEFVDLGSTPKATLVKGATVNVPTGYYLIKDDGKTDMTDDSYSLYLIQVAGDITITPKTSIPTVDKTVENKNKTKTVSTADYNVGENVPFELTATLADISKYDTYKVKFNDELSSGLSLNEGTIVVTLDGKTVEKDNYSFEKEGQKFYITLDDVIALGAKTNGAVVKVNYTAKLTSNALKASEEDNKVTLEYSNNPNNKGTGTTKEKEVYVYDFDIAIDKYDGANEATKLEGAQFVLMNAAGKYYKVDGTTKAVSWEDDQTNATTVTTGADGAANFTGLAAGTYQLVETKAPDGYNLLKNPVPVNITIEYNNDGTIKKNEDGSYATTATVNGDNQLIQTTQVANNSGMVLPSTGGMGTKIFYVLGSLLAVAAVILLVTRRRMSNEA